MKGVAYVHYVIDASRLMLPKERILLSAYSERERHLKNEGGGHVGKWENSFAPYLIEPMDCLDSYDYQTVCVVGPGQSGKTSIAENWLLKSVDIDPGDILWYMQTDDTKNAYVKQRIDPMIASHPAMANSVGQKPVDNSLEFKRFKTMTAQFLTASAANLINKSAPRIVIDEIDAYDKSLGNVKPLVDVRRQTFGFQSKVLAISHPDRATGLNPDKHWNDGIMSIYADSDRRIAYWECPDCGAWSSPCPTAERVMAMDYDDEADLDKIEKDVKLVCPVNGCLLNEAKRRVMIRNGFKWIGTGQTIDELGKITGELVKKRTAGFWVVGLMSPFLLDGMGGLAKARVKAERELENGGEDMTLRQVMVKQFGVPYQKPKSVGSVTAEELAERSEPNLRLRWVPEGVRFLTAFADVQGKHFDIMVRGWGERGESWIIDRFKVPGLPASNPDDWDKLVDKVVRAAYPLEGRTDLLMPIRGFGFDSGGMPGVTRQAMDAWLRWKRDGEIKPRGKVAGREVWSAIPTKGANTLNAQRLTVTYPDTSGRKDRSASRGNVPVAIFNPNLYKDDLMGQLSRGSAGPWSVHFPAALRSAEGPHVFFEEMVSEESNAAGRWEKISSGARNETLDLMVGTHLIATLHGLNVLSWRSPPSWAAPWDSNGFLVAAESVASVNKKHNNAPKESQPETGVKVIVKTDKKKSSIAGKLAQ